MAIPWAACILAHRFNEFKWLDWMATINRPYAALAMDRPLVREISYSKSIANRVARLIKFKHRTRHPALRPVAASTPEDAQIVAMTLKRYCMEKQHFSCSNPALIAQQRKRMYERCAEFANEYQLEFSPV
jgi:hypothetical protein